MFNERMQILKMVEDGKISVDEAAKLLEVLGATPAPDGPTMEEKFNNFTKDMKEFCKDVGQKMNDLYKAAEPKIKEFTKNVVAKTANIADNISQSLNEKVRKMEACECEEECTCAPPCECECEEEPPADNGPPCCDKTDKE